MGDHTLVTGGLSNMGHRPPDGGGGAISLAQSLSGVQIAGGNLNVVGGDQHQHRHYHAHNHTPLQPTNKIPTILDQVANYRDIHIGNLSRATEGTGPRFVQWEEFCEWISGQSILQTLWGSGMPGAGKTIFASIVINEVEARAKASEYPISVCYIYFRYSDHTTATVLDFLLVFVKQTIERHAECLPAFDQLFARHIREKTLPSESDLVQLLGRFSEAIGAAFYFLDGLDEAPPDVQFDLLKKLSALNVKIFITSRPLPNLDACFPGAHHFSIRAEDHDLELHIAEEIARSPVLRSILNQGGPTLHERIALTIKEKCGGMFLHASLQLDALRDCTNVYDVEKTLEDFPPRIEDVYQQTWSRILAQTPKVVALAKNVLVWVLCTTRSLGIEELCRVVAICPETHKFDPNRLVDAATLMALCRGLVNIEEGTNIVRFVHYTAKDVVKHLISESSPYPDSLPAAFCMALLAERGFQQNIHDEDAFNAALNDESLLEYAYTNWSAHAHKSLDDTTVASRLSHFIRGCYAFPVRLHSFGYEILEPLHMAAYFDFPLSIAGSAHLRNPNHPTPYRGRTPLMLALRENSLSAMRELLSLPRILVNAADENGDIPLIWAVIWHKTESLSLLLGHPKVNVNAHDHHGRTALMRTVSKEEAILLLAHPKIKPNQVDPHGETALMFASRKGFLGVVQALLADPRVQVNPRSKHGKTALDKAQEQVEEEPRNEWQMERRRRYEPIVSLLRARIDRDRLRRRHWDEFKDLLRRALSFLKN